jgi:hypothetical protein
MPTTIQRAEALETLESLQLLHETGKLVEELNAGGIYGGGIYGEELDSGRKRCRQDSWEEAMEEEWDVEEELGMLSGELEDSSVQICRELDDPELDELDDLTHRRPPTVARPSPLLALPDLQPVIHRLESMRYWQSRKMGGAEKALSVMRWFHQPWFDNPRVFRGHFRMNRESFEAVLARIEGHAIFHNSTAMQQTPVRYQLAVFLYRLGSKGQGDTQLHTATAVGIGEGTVRLFTHRVLVAILALKGKLIRWPSQEEREAHKQRVCAGSGGVFSGCVGFVDGTFITLLYAPLKDWVFYYNRKSSYALNAMVVCTDQKRIIYVRAGDTSAVHDTRVFDNSRLASSPECFFGPGEYLIGDSAYTVNKRMIAPFKKPRANTDDCKQFNATLSSRRIAIEHVFGLIKARFPSVTAVSIRIKDDKSHRAVVNWFEAACVLHNFLLDADEMEWDEGADLNMARTHQEEVENVQAEVEEKSGKKNSGKSEEGLREAILQCMLSIHKEN